MKLKFLGFALLAVCVCAVCCMCGSDSKTPDYEFPDGPDPDPDPQPGDYPAGLTVPSLRTIWAAENNVSDSWPWPT